MKNLGNILKVLLESKIDFILIGGFAGVVHGADLVTKDIDICAVLSPDNIKKFRETLRDYHPKHRMNPSHKPSFLTHPEDLSDVDNLYLETDLGVLDVISSVTGVGSYEDLGRHAVKIKLYGYECSVISIEDLIKAKEKMGRRKDLLAVQELNSILNKIKK